jgi:phage shock protein E
MSAAQVLRRSLVLPLVAVVLLTGCGSEDDATVPTGVGSEVTAPAEVQNLAPEEGAALIESLGAGLTVVDVRTPAEFAEGHLEGATNLDIEGGQFTTAIADLPRDEPYMVYCRSGRRSSAAAQAMIDAGFTDVYDLGAITDWAGAGLPVVTD